MALHLADATSVALRRFRSRPAFALGAIALLALSVGASTAIFTLLNAIVLRPLPLREPERLVAISIIRDDGPSGALSLPNFVDLRRHAGGLEGLSALFQWSANLTGEAEAERLQGMRVTADYMETLGARAARGRIFNAGDTRPGREAVAVIADGLWRRRFGGAPDAIGRTLLLNGERHTIVGILPPDFVLQVRDAEVLVPFSPETDPRRANRGLAFLRVTARLKPGVSIEQAHAELDALVWALRARFPADNVNDKGVRVLPLKEAIVGRTDWLLRVIGCAVALVLLTACANLSALLLVSGTGRQQELATRRALGASRAVVVAQLLVESLLLAVAGSAAGFLLARGFVAAFLAAGPSYLPRAAEVSAGPAALAFAAVLSAAAALVSGSLPALQLSRAVFAGGLSAQRGVTAGGTRLRTTFVFCEVALSVILLLAAGLLVRSLEKLQRVEPGFDRRGVLSVRLSLPRAAYRQTADIDRFARELAPRIAALPGVSSVAATNVVPLNGYLATAEVVPEGGDISGRAPAPEAHYRMISPDYFKVLGIPLEEGRGFTDHDEAGAQPVAILSRALARRYWPGRSPLGVRVHVRDNDGAYRLVEIVGVAGSVRHLGLDADPVPEIFIPIAQVPDTTSVWLANNMYWLTHTAGEPLGYVGAIRHEVAAVDPRVPASFARSMDQWIEQSIETRRFNMRLIALFAVAALLLSSVGIFTVAAESVALRTREIGIRAALGASQRRLSRIIVLGGLAPVGAGLAAGLLIALPATRLLSALLFGVVPGDPVAVTAVAILVGTSALAAVYVPARRVRAIDPVVALRVE